MQYAKVTKLTSDAKFEESDIKASIAALSFILSSAAKHSVDGDSLDNELQQLGLPKGWRRASEWGREREEGEGERETECGF